MKKIIFILIFVFNLIIISSCQLVKSTTTQTNTIIDPDLNIIGVRIQLQNHPVYTHTLKEYFYYNDGEIPDIIYNVKTENLVENETLIKHYILEMARISDCIKIDFITQNNNISSNNENLFTCGTVSSYSIAHSKKYDKGFKYTIKFLDDSELLEYKVIEYDNKNNKINELSIDLSESNITVNLNKNTAYIKILTVKRGIYDNLNNEVKIVNVDDKTIEYQDKTYTLNSKNNIAMYYHITYKFNTSD